VVAPRARRARRHRLASAERLINASRIPRRRAPSLNGPSVARSRAAQLLKAVEDYVEKRNLPEALGKKISAYFEYQHRKHGSGTAEIYEQLPNSIKVKVSIAQYLRQMQATWVFHGCARAAQPRRASYSHLRAAPPPLPLWATARRRGSASKPRSS
jgi:hypothetical protein